jgi:hypothetical protein
MKVAAVLACTLASASAFQAPSAFAGRALATRAAPKANRVAAPSMSVFTDAQEEFSSNYPQIAKYGWGPSTKAERWNGRHAMFGWVVIIGTLYAQAHHLIPNPTETLNLKQWGTLATISGKETISQERAIILIAHVHALFVSLCSAWLPLNYMDSLLLDADSGEVDEPAIGVFPKFSTGITMGAEILNGRMAMMGLITASGYSIITGTAFLDTVDLWTGHLITAGAAAGAV